MRAAVLISGKGRLLNHLLNLPLKVKIELVIGHNEKVPGLELVKDKVKCIVCSAERVFRELDKCNIDLAILAGWLKFLTVPEHWTNRVINMHPSLLPSFGGKGMYGERVHRAVIDSGVKYSGCTVHFVDNQYDNGPIIAQEIVSVEETDTPETLYKKIAEKEFSLYPQVIDLFPKLKVKDRRVFIS